MNLVLGKHKLNKGFGNLPYIRLCLLCVVALARFDLYCNPPQID